MSAPKLIHYHAPQTRSVTTRWLFEELGSPPHELKVLNLRKMEHKSPEYLAINPMGKVPAIVHGNTVISEAAAIALYLADIFPDANLAPAIGDPARGTYYRWIVFKHAAVEPAVTDFSLKRDPGPPGMLGYGTYGSTVETLASALAKGPYILGNRFSAADILIGSSIRWLTLNRLLPERPEFMRYVDRLAERPAFQRAVQEDAELAKALAA